MSVFIKLIEKEVVALYLAIPDLTAAKKPHVIHLLYKKIEDFIRAAHPHSEILVHRGSPIVSVEENYDDLLVPKDNISRSSTYTHYTDMKHVLRTHTSAGVADVLRDLQKRDDWGDVVMVLPGLVYRRDVTDRKHLGIIHQIDIWRVHKGDSRDRIEKSDLLRQLKGLRI